MKHKIVNNIECKPCTCCGRTLPLSDFYVHKRARDGRQTICKECHLARLAQSRADRKEVKKALLASQKRQPKTHSRIYEATDDDRCGTCKSFSSCGNGNGFCMRMKASVKRGDTCADYCPDTRKQYQGEAKAVNIFHSSPWD